MQAFEISWIVATFLLTLKEVAVVDFAQCAQGDNILKRWSSFNLIHYVKHRIRMEYTRFFKSEIFFRALIKSKCRFD